MIIIIIVTNKTILKPTGCCYYQILSPLHDPTFYL